MNKVTIENFSVTIVETDDGKFLLVDKKGHMRIANNVIELLKIIKNMF